MYTIPYNCWDGLSQFNLLHIDNIIKLQRLHRQISRLNWAEVEKNILFIKQYAKSTQISRLSLAELEKNILFIT